MLYDMLLAEPEYRNDQLRCCLREEHVWSSEPGDPIFIPWHTRVNTNAQDPYGRISSQSPVGASIWQDPIARHLKRHDLEGDQHDWYGKDSYNVL